MARLHGLGDAGRHRSSPRPFKDSSIQPNRRQRAKEQRAQGYGMSWARRKPMKLPRVPTLLWCWYETRSCSDLLPLEPPRRMWKPHSLPALAKQSPTNSQVVGYFDFHATNSSSSQIRSVIPAAIAGVIRRER